MQTYAAQQSQSIYEPCLSVKRLLDHSDGMDMKERQRQRNEASHKVVFLFELLLAFLWSYSGFVGCLQPVHRDKVVQRSDSQ